jgi:hypothetical protein
LSPILGGRGARTLVQVDPKATAIHLEVRLDGELPVGRAYDDQGSIREFAGWTALVATIDDLLTIAQPGFDTRPGGRSTVS